jgi:ATP-dependent DNA helicase RecG
MTDWSEVSVEQIKGVGPKLLILLHKQGIFTLGDLLIHLPYRYEDRRYATPGLTIEMGKSYLLRGQIVRAHLNKGRRSSWIVLMHTSDNTPIQLRFFHFNAYQAKAFKPGEGIEVYGEIKASYGAQAWEIIHPQYKLFPLDRPPAFENGARGIYASTEGLSQFQWRKLIAQAFEHPAVQTAHEGLLTDLKALHFPAPEEDIQQLNAFIHPLQQKLVLEELTAHRLALLQQELSNPLTSPSLPFDAQRHHQFLQRLSFAPTGAQIRVQADISQDLAKIQPMLRLVQGDVGSGKTLVAAMAALQALAQDYQVALMAPTELLAQQHFKVFEEWFAPLGLECVFLSGRLKGPVRQGVLERLRQPRGCLAIGTHALFQQQVDFAKLALVIIDEQHRFGVEQRLRLSQKAANHQPHQLIMTATPIPRTLAMSSYGHIDISLLDELPAGRKPIKTSVLAQDKLDALIARIAQAADEGQQIYWVCPLIEDSDEINATASQVRHQSLCESLPHLNIGHIHGKLKEAEKNQAMQDFIENRSQILVATTVIEVGVNVPNASIMVIEDAQRMGLAQLHQLRGRVGRGSVESYCILLYTPPLSLMSQARLNLMRETQDGFLIAEKDLELRGPGEILGKAQTGVAQFRLADLSRDYALIEVAHQHALQLLSEPEKAQELKRRWLHHKEEFGKA